jgi:acyl-coenzyme A thioesterase PaaI-like protein
MISLQDLYAPNNRCFGCGPANDRGLRLKSHADGDEVVAEFMPEAHHQAFAGIVNGGIIGALLDCHSNWTAAYVLMRERELAVPPCSVTAEFHVKLRAPTPLHERLSLVARAVEVTGDRVTVDAEIRAAGRKTATCQGIFVAVREGHPAFHRW